MCPCKKKGSGILHGSGVLTGSGIRKKRRRQRKRGSGVLTGSGLPKSKMIGGRGGIRRTVTNKSRLLI